jgi:hypothetical protein
MRRARSSACDRNCVTGKAVSIMSSGRGRRPMPWFRPAATSAEAVTTER